MKKAFKNIIFAGAFIFLVASPVMAVTVAQPAKAACGDETFLFVPAWYRGLSEEKNGNCVIKSPSDFSTSTDKTGLSTFIWRIVLNGIEMALVLIAYIALFFILYGGFLFITGGGNATQVEKARKSIFNAVIGLIISLGAIAITNLIFSTIIGSTSATNADGILVRDISDQELLRNGLNLAYYIAGIIAVIVIIIAGLMYTTSMGDSGRVTRAKNMILYAVIGLGILLAAFAITNFIMGTF